VVQHVPYDSSVTSTPGELQSLLRHFFRSPGIAAKDIRELLDRDRRRFCADATRIFRGFDGASAGGQFLVGLLLERGLLVRTLCDTTVDAEHVRAVLTAALAASSDADLTLARGLVEAAQMKDGAVSRDGLLRALNLLDQLADPNRITPRLLALLRHPDGHLRSKTVLMVGRCGRNVPWARRQLADADARTRANAVEALWGCEDPEARELLSHAARDANSRVAGNALMGMYLAGEAASIALLIEMAGRHAPRTRASAAWVMGNTGDPRFIPVLNTLGTDDNALVRRVAVAALKRIQEEDTPPGDHAPLWRVAAFSEPSELVPASRRVRLALQYADATEPPPIPPTQFVIAENGRLVTSYTVEQCPVAEKLAIALVFPAKKNLADTSLFAGVMRALNWKRPHDAWVPIPYMPPRHWHLRATLLGEVIEIAPPEEKPADLVSPALLTDPEVIAGAFEDLAPNTVRPSLWDAVRCAAEVLRGAGLESARSHIIVHSPEAAERLPNEPDPCPAIIQADIPIHAITGTEDEILRDICRKTGGTCQVAANETELTELVERAHLNLLARYRIVYQPENPANPCEVRIRAPGGWAKVPVS
jgi:hypothetical protein